MVRQTLIFRSADTFRLGLIEVWEVLLECREFRQVVVDDIGLIGVQREVVLMVVFGRIKAAERNYLGYDWLGERVLLLEPRDVVIGHLLLSVVLIEDRGPILSS